MHGLYDSHKGTYFVGKDTETSLGSDCDLAPGPQALTGKAGIMWSILTTIFHNTFRLL